MNISACGEITFFMPRPVNGEGGRGEVRISDWEEVRNVTRCEDFAETNCLGLFGFSVSESGAFEAGPDPNGERETGQVTSEELQSLTTAVDAMIDAQTGLICSDIALSPGILERIVAISPQGEEMVLFEEIDPESGACFRGSEAQARQLQQTYFNLMTRYYPSDFGSATGFGSPDAEGATPDLAVTE